MGRKPAKLMHSYKIENKTNIIRQKGGRAMPEYIRTYRYESNRI